MVTAVAGLVRRGGVVRVFGQVLPAGSPGAAVRAGLVLVPERRPLYPELTTRDNIMLGSYSRTRRISARQAWEDVSGVLDMFPQLARLLDPKAGPRRGGRPPRGRGRRAAGCSAGPSRASASPRRCPAASTTGSAR